MYGAAYAPYSAVACPAAALSVHHQTCGWSRLLADSAALLPVSHPSCWACDLDRDLQHNKQHQQLAPLAASLYYHAAFAPAAGATASSTPSASGGTGTAEVGSCGSNGEGAGRHTQVPGKRRASNADAGRTAAAGGGVSGDEGSSDDEVLQLPRKRSRVLGAAGQLLLHLQADPERSEVLLLHPPVCMWVGCLCAQGSMIARA